MFIAVYSLFIDPAQFVFVSEIFPTIIRAKGIGLAFFAYFVGAITYTAPAAVAFKNIGWQMYMVWFAVTCVSAILIYFFVPETKGIALEEIGQLFGDEVALHMTADQRGVIELKGKDGVLDHDAYATGEKLRGVDAESAHIETVSNQPV